MVCHGLRLRPLAETATDTLEWFRSPDYERQSNLRSGGTPEREAELLAVYRQRWLNHDLPVHFLALMPVAKGKAETAVAQGFIQ